MGKKQFTAEQAKEYGEKLGIDWKKFDNEQFRYGNGCRTGTRNRRPEHQCNQ